MFKYQFHKLSKGGKDAHSVYLEDILTSDVFGIMYYLPHEDLLQPYLQKILSQNRQADFSVPSKAPERFDFWKSFPWPDHLPRLRRQSIEPDVVIEWEDLVIFVEAKFVSATDPEELLREYLIGSCVAGNSRDFRLLLIDRNLSVPAVYERGSGRKTSIENYIARRLHDLGLRNHSSHQKISSSFWWSNWQSFYRVVQKRLSMVAGEENSTKYPYRRLIEDLLALMKKKELQPFEKLDLNILTGCLVDLDTLADVGLMVVDPLNTLADCRVDFDSLDVWLGDLASLPDVSRTLVDPLGAVTDRLKEIASLADYRVEIASLTGVGLMVVDPLEALASKTVDPISIGDLAGIF